jgi:hypothetical protein
MAAAKGRAYFYGKIQIRHEQKPHTNCLSISAKEAWPSELGHGTHTDRFVIFGLL